LFLAGELEIISGNKISDKEKKGRIELLKKISYFYELHEWKGITKLYAHIIRQIENGLADWTHDFSEIETPLHIKYVKIEQRGNKVSKRKLQKKMNTCFIALFINVKNVPSQILIMEK
jgi:hypothetical protein